MINQLKVVVVGPIDDRFCSFGYFDVAVPPRVMLIEVACNYRFLWKLNVANPLFHYSFILVWCLKFHVVDVQEDSR